MKDIQTICLDNDGFDLLILSNQIKSADYDYAGAVVRAERMRSMRSISLA